MLALLALLAVAAEPPPGGWPDPPAEERVTDVYDGDTVTLSTGDRVRLRWVNTPEMRPKQPFAQEAKEAAQRFVEGRRVKLIVDPDNARDGYGRIIAGLQTERGSLSEHLLEQGLAHLFVIPPNDTDLAPLIAAQSRAKKAHKGIWTTEAYQGTLHFTSFHANARGDDRENVNGEYLRACNVSEEPVDLSGYRLTDADGNEWVLPQLVVPAGHTVKIHTGQGEHQTDPAKQLAVYLGNDGPVWGNSGDTATLYDPDGEVVDRSVHKDGG